MYEHGPRSVGILHSKVSEGRELAFKAALDAAGTMMGAMTHLTSCRRTKRVLGKEEEAILDAGEGGPMDNAITMFLTPVHASLLQVEVGTYTDGDGLRYNCRPRWCDERQKWILEAIEFCCKAPQGHCWHRTNKKLFASILVE